MKEASSTRDQKMRTLVLKTKKAATSVNKSSLKWVINNSHSNNYGGAAMAKYNIGVDYHKKFSYLVVKDKEGRVLRNGQIQNTYAHVSNFLEPFMILLTLQSELLLMDRPQIT